MKKEFILPNVQVVKFEAKDVITTSGGNHGNNGHHHNPNNDPGANPNNPGWQNKTGGATGGAKSIAVDPTRFVW